MIAALAGLLGPAARLAAGGIRARKAKTPLPPRWPERAALLMLFPSVVAAMARAQFGPATTPVMGVGALGPSVRIDAVSVSLIGLVGFPGWVILRLATPNLHGEPGEGPFIFWMALTIAGVLLLVSAGHLAQVAFGGALSGLGVARLLAFHADRPGARRAARQQIPVSRGADIAQAIALVLLGFAYGTSSSPRSPRRRSWRSRRF